MSFFRKKWSWPLLPTAVIGLLVSVSPVPATEKPDQGVQQRDEVDLAKIQAGGKIVLISSGPRGPGFKAIDDDHRTAIRFLSDDPRPTLVVQLIENRPIHRVSTVAGSKSEKIDVYLLNELPRKPSDLDKLNPVASILEPIVGREASVDFAPQNARYVALRWTLSAMSRETLSVSEVSVFTRGDSPVVLTALAATDPPIYLVPDPPILPPISP